MINLGTPIALDGASGLTMIPSGDATSFHTVAADRVDEAVFAQFAACAVADPAKIVHSPGSGWAPALVPVLVPRPDNDYDHRAIQIADPGPDSPDERHLGF